MSDYKRFAQKDNEILIINGFHFTCEEVEQRNQDYLSLTPEEFARKYRSWVYKSAMVFDFFENKHKTFQFNYCLNPLCKWFGLDQKRFIDLPNKPSRYKLVSQKNSIKAIACNDIPDKNIEDHVLNHTTDTISNWSLSEEITHLKSITRLIYTEEEYKFHRDGCKCKSRTPFGEYDRPYFHKRGKSTGNSVKWQCKECKKITNVLPSYRDNFTYRQKQNEIMPQLATLLLSRTPVSNTCKILNISPDTYYHKLELLYKRTLEFLNKYETEALKAKQFSEIYLNTDQLVYTLNNIRKRGKVKRTGADKYKNLEDKKMITNIIASSDMFSRYVFRCDLNYDFNITMEQIEQDTKANHDDHAYSFERQHDRLRFTYAPQPPTSNDTQTMAEYEIEKAAFDRRKQYVEGCHVGAGYTATAHYWLLKEMINTNSWCFISDEDWTLSNGIMRIFAPEIRQMDADYFICRLDKTLTKKDSYEEAIKKRNDLRRWAKSNGINTYNTPIEEIAFEKLVKTLDVFDFYEYETINGRKYPIKSVNYLEHPLPDIDEGVRFIKPLNNLNHYDAYTMADIIMKINTRSINTFFNMVRRKISILERPLVTSRGDGRTYIYSNYNPRYAHYALTILRAVYNFCWDYKDLDKSKSLTPAQRLGLTDKKFTIEDIIYLK